MSWLSLAFGFLSGWQKYLMIAGAVILLCGVSYIKGCSDERVHFVEFKAKTEALGEAAAKKAKETELADKKRKEVADRESQVNRKRIADLSKRLRDSRSHYLPPAPSGSPSPERACFGRPELESAIGRLDERISGIVAEGDKAIVDLDSAKRWAQ